MRLPRRQDGRPKTTACCTRAASTTGFCMSSTACRCTSGWTARTALRPIQKWSSRSTCIVGHVPPEFGFKSGGVIEVRTSSRKSDSWLGNVQATTGSDATHQGSSVFGGPLSASTALTARRLGTAIGSLSRSRASGQPAQQRQCRECDGRVQLARVAVEHAVDCRRRRAFELRRAAQRRTGRGRAGSAAEESADVADGVVAARVVRRHRVAGRRRTIARARRCCWAPSTTRRCSSAPTASLRRTGVLGSVTHHRGKHVLKAGVEAARLEPARRFLVLRDG